MEKKAEKGEVSMRSSKAEILEAYENVVAKQSEFSSMVPADKRVEEMIKVEEKKLVERASSYTVEGIVKGLADLHVHIGKALGELSEKLTTEAVKLEDLKKAIEIESRSLEEIRDIRVAADALAVLIQEYETKRSSFEEEAARRREEWQREQGEHDAMVRQRNETLAREREREREEYEYTLSLTRKKERDAYEQEKADLERALKEEKTAHERRFAEREADLAARESELTELRKRAETFQNSLEEAVREAEERVAATVKEKAETAGRILAKEVEGEKKVLELKIANLQELVKKQEAQVESLTKQLADANAEVQAIAVKAIEGASGARTLSTVQEIALEQAKQSKLQK